jgi:hypothetical protein
MSDPKNGMDAFKDYAERVNKVAIAHKSEDGNLHLGECVVVLSAMLALTSVELVQLTGNIEAATKGVDAGHKLADILRAKGAVGFAEPGKRRA